MYREAAINSAAMENERGKIDMRHQALEWLYRQVRKKRQALGSAEKRPGCTAEELANLKNSIDILEYVCGVVLAKGE